MVAELCSAICAVGRDMSSHLSVCKSPPCGVVPRMPYSKRQRLDVRGALPYHLMHVSIDRSASCSAVSLGIVLGGVARHRARHYRSESCSAVSPRLGEQPSMLVASTRSRTHGLGHTVSDTRSRTHGLGHTVSDARSRTHGLSCLCHGRRSPEPHAAARAAYDPHCLQRHIRS